MEGGTSLILMLISTRNTKMKIYILQVESSSNFRHGLSYIDLVSFDERTIWNRIEELFYPRINIILDNYIGYKISEITINENGVYIAYENFVEDIYEVISYGIVIKEVS